MICIVLIHIIVKFYTDTEEDVHGVTEYFKIDPRWF